MTPEGRGSPSRREAPPLELPELHPRGAGEILDIALDLLRARFGACIFVPFLLWIPASLLSRLQPASEFEISSLGEQMLATLLIQNVTVAFVTVVIYHQLQGSAVGTGQALRLGLAQAPALLVQSVLTGIVTFLGFACCFPGVLLSFIWSIAPSALVLERLGPIAAMARSAQLVRKGFNRWSGIMSMLMLLSLPFSGVAGALEDPTVRSHLERWVDWSHPATMAAQTLLGSLLFAVATAFAAIVLTVFYLDSRVRQEGLDLWMRLERLGDEPLATPGGLEQKDVRGGARA